MSNFEFKQLFNVDEIRLYYPDGATEDDISSTDWDNLVLIDWGGFTLFFVALLFTIHMYYIYTNL